MTVDGRRNGDAGAGASAPLAGAGLGRPTRARQWVIVFAVTLAIITYVDRVCISQAESFIRQDLGLTSRSDLSGLMRRHFVGLAEMNNRDMKWKKFFYRELCQREGVLICKSPNCEVCADAIHCFGPEEAPTRPCREPDNVGFANTTVM